MAPRRMAIAFGCGHLSHAVAPNGHKFGVCHPARDAIPARDYGLPCDLRSVRPPFLPLSVMQQQPKDGAGSDRDFGARRTGPIVAQLFIGEGKGR